MLTVDQFARIRQLRRDGLTIRQLAEQLNHSPKTILKALADPEPTPVTHLEPRSAPVFGPFRDLVDGILVEDETASPFNMSLQGRGRLKNACVYDRKWVSPQVASWGRVCCE